MEIKNVSFGYNRKQTVFDDFSLTLGEGSVYGLLGTPHRSTATATNR